MSGIKDILKEVFEIIETVVDTAQDNPVKVAATAEMLASAVRFARDMWEQFDEKGDLSPEQELALYKAHDDFLTEQKTLMKAKLAAARNEAG